MSNEHFDPPRPIAAHDAPAGRPDEHDDAWDRVLDCGAPGPAREQPALFYQESRAPSVEINRPKH
jgi:hypothetical protein